MSNLYSEGGSFRIQDLPQYQTWENLVREYLEQEEELARVEADIDRYKHENNDLKERNLAIEQQLRDLKFKMEEKQRMIAELEAKLRNIEIEREKLERIRMVREDEGCPKDNYQARIRASLNRIVFKIPFVELLRMRLSRIHI